MLAALVLAASVNTSSVACNRGAYIKEIILPRLGDPRQRQFGSGGVAIVEVTIDSAGRVTNGTIAQSSGTSAGDEAAIAAARASTFYPAMHACRPIGSALSIDEPVPPADCTVPYRDARVVRLAPVDSSVAQIVTMATVAVIEVRIGPHGEVQAATVSKSSGYPMLDSRAVDAARRTIFAPRTLNCIPTAGEYLLQIPFVP